MSDFVFYDADWDGIQDAGEAGIADVLVTLTITYPDGSTTILTTLTDANGLYSFGNLLLDEDFNGVGTYGSGGTEPMFVITVTAPEDNEPSPSNQGGDDAVDSDDGIVGEQTQPAMGNTDATNDFGYYGRHNSDFGDAPATYVTTRGSNGPRHIVFPDLNSDYKPESRGANAAIWLGALVDPEDNGIPTANANGDNMDSINDEDGVTLVDSAQWQEGTDGGTIRVTLSSSEVGTRANTGYLMVWFDWNHDGDFVGDANELVVSEAVSWLGLSDQQEFTFDIPSGDSPLMNDQIYRARLFSSQPGNLSTAYSGLTVNGEVEDYYIPVSSLPVTLTYFHASTRGESLFVEWSTGTETGNVGFNIYKQTPEGKEKLNDALIQAKGFTTHDPHDYLVELRGVNVDADTIFFIEDLDIVGRTHLQGPFKLGVVNGEKVVGTLTDWGCYPGRS